MSFPHSSLASLSMTPVMVIIIEPELEFDELELLEAVVPIAGAPSLLAGSADPGEEPPKNKKTARTEAKHRNLISRLNVPSSHPGQGAPNRRDLFSQKTLFQETATSLT